MSDNVQFFVLLGVVAFSNFQTSMTLWREYRKGVETIIEHIDKRGSADAQKFWGLASNNAFRAENPQCNGFIVVDDCAAGDAVSFKFGDEVFKIGGNLGKNQIKPVLSVSKLPPLKESADAFCGAKSNAAVNEGAYQIPQGSGD